MKKLAVLLPTYNAAQYLQLSIESLLNQTIDDFDIYIYDDNSIDNTKEIVESFKDSRIFYSYNSSNLGIAKTLNKGLEELLYKYEFIARMDADDWCYPQRLEKQLDFLKKNQDFILCGTQGYWLKDMGLNPNDGWTYPIDPYYVEYYLLFGATFGHSSVVIRSESFIKFNFRYDETMATCEDWELWTRISKMGKMANLPDFLMKYRILSNSNHRSLKNNKLHLLERSKIISDYWMHYGINLTTNEIFNVYFSIDKTTYNLFIINLKIIITTFNNIYSKANNKLSIYDRKNFSYLLARRILSYWKRSGVAFYDPRVWFLIVSKVTFRPKIQLIKSLL